MQKKTHLMKEVSCIKLKNTIQDTHNIKVVYWVKNIKQEDLCILVIEAQYMVWINIILVNNNTIILNINLVAELIMLVLTVHRILPIKTRLKNKAKMMLNRNLWKNAKEKIQIITALLVNLRAVRVDLWAVVAVVC